jgi:amidohydrolase
MPNIDFKAEAEAMRDELVARRRDFHRHPELAFEEYRTAGIVAEELSKLGLEVQTGVGKTGVVGMLEGDREGPTVLVRADMDALPIHELNETDYISTASGKMHACGHDGHTTIALGVAKLFAKHRNHISGRIKFVFQPAEEVVGGAAAMVADGVLENPHPDVSLGLHLWNGSPVGTLGVADGPIMAGSSTFRIVITGRGGHAASPHRTADPLICAAHLITTLQTIVSRNVDPLEQAVVTVAYMRAGEAYNIIPQDVELRGTVRTFKTEVRDLVEQRMRELTESLCKAMGCAAQFEISHNTKPVANNVEVSDRLRGVFRNYINPDLMDINERTMGAEDVGLFMDDIPGMYFFLGSANSERGLDYAHHHPRFDFDEEALTLGVTLMSAAVAEYILPRN